MNSCTKQKETQTQNTSLWLIKGDVEGGEDKVGDWG